MGNWVAIRENLIGGWHQLLDYNSKRSSVSRVRIAKARAKSQARRFQADAVKAATSVARFEKLEKRHQTRIEDSRRQKLQEQAELGRLPKSIRCPGCGRRLKAMSRGTDGASGCLILIIGLTLTPFLIGIPIIIVGIHYMGKKKTYWGCPRCGV